MMMRMMAQEVVEGGKAAAAEEYDRKSHGSWSPRGPLAKKQNRTAVRLYEMPSSPAYHRVDNRVLWVLLLILCCEMSVNSSSSIPLSRVALPPNPQSEFN